MGKRTKVKIKGEKEIGYIEGYVSENEKVFAIVIMARDFKKIGIDKIVTAS